MDKLTGDIQRFSDPSPSNASVADGGPEVDEVRAFLSGHHSEAISKLELLHGGFWSAAYGYRVDGRDLVLQIGQMRAGFEMDRDAMAYNARDLPVPDVLEIGDAFGGAYAISVRHRGRFLETVAAPEAEVVGPTIVRLLRALKATPARATTPSDWRNWLLSGLVDDPSRKVSGWRNVLATDPTLDSLFRACSARVSALIAACPERNDLVHGDLLHSNVLISDDASRVTAVFSWKSSTRGDFLFDTAWCSFWGTFHPGIAAADIFHRVVRDVSIARDPAALDHAAERHHCYELHVGATHLGWNAWIGDEEALRAVATRTEAILERGPLSMKDR